MTSFDYIGRLQAILEDIRTIQMPAIREAGRLVAASLAAGGIVHAFGSGHSHMIAEEAFFRAGGLAPVNPIFDARLQFLEGAIESTHAEREAGAARQILDRENLRPEDIAIVISNSGRNAVPVEMAEEIRSRGVKVIAITNVRQSQNCTPRTASGRRLCEVADLVIDNSTPPGDAVLELPGLPGRIGPSSTVASAAIVNSIMIEAALDMAHQGLPIPLLPSANTSDSDAELAALLKRYSTRIRYFEANNL
jgi:uncharacterized phosphosugar-binding protein